jgi:endonuclease YncB( thermonuclease family)
MNKLFLALLTICLASASAKADVITKVYDGDTVTTSTGEKIRLACIDAPEIKTNRHGKKDPIKGPASQKWLSKLVLGKEVKVERLVKDLYGRTIARLFLEDGAEVNELSVVMGYSVPYMSKYCEWVLPSLSTRSPNK